jgi:hypothetical protein
MSKKKNVRITKGTGTWKVTQGGHSVSRHQTHRAALNAAVEVAKRDGAIYVTHDGDSKTTYKILYVPYDSTFLTNQSSKKAILSRKVPASAGKPSVSRTRIAKAVQSVMRDSNTGRWISRKSAS